MMKANNSGQASLGASSHASRNSCQCTAVTTYYDTPYGGSIEAYDPAYTCPSCEEAFTNDVIDRFGSIAAMEDECQYHVFVPAEAHFYLHRKYSIHYCYIDPIRRAEMDALVHDDLPF